MCFLLAFKRVNLVGRNRREEQAADELRRINHVKWLVLLALPSFDSGFKVQGSRGGFAAFFYWAMLESGILVMRY